MVTLEAKKSAPGRGAVKVSDKALPCGSCRNEVGYE